jgi:anti-sigma regulatory factor (Ser/Thr protein kinase)
VKDLPMNIKLTLLMQNRVGDLIELTNKADEFMQSHQLPLEIIYKVNLILEEALTNIIKYAYKDTLAHDIRIEMTLKEHELIVEFQDDGEEFDPISAPTPETPDSISESPIGGLGIHLVKQMADGVEYNRHEGCNILTTRIKLRPAD